MPQPLHHRFNLCTPLELQCNWAREKVIPHFPYWLPWYGTLSFFPLSDSRNPIQCRVSQESKETQTQIQSARSRWGTWMNSPTEGPGMSFADILAENNLCLILFQQIPWPITSKSIHYYYLTHITLSISRSQTLNNVRHYDWKNCCWGPVFVVIGDISPSVERDM